MKSEFWVLRCPECGQWKVKEARKNIADSVLDCFSCNKNTTVKQEGVWGLSVQDAGKYYTGKQAGDVCAKKNMETKNGT